MAERVVVLLEAVEVEDREHPRLAASGLLERLSEIVEERAPVSEARKRIGERFDLALLEQGRVLAEREGAAHEDQHDGERRERHRERMELAGGAGGEDGDRCETADDGRPEEGALLGRARPHLARSVPGGEGERHERDGPRQVDGSSLDVGTGSRLVNGAAFAIFQLERGVGNHRSCRIGNSPGNSACRGLRKCRRGANQQCKQKTY